jgi:hypothetical protein
VAAQEPRTRFIDADDVQQSWPDALAAVARRGERVALQEDGVTVAALVSVQDLERLRRFDADREKAFKDLERIAAAFAHETPEESDRLAALALAEVREEKRRQRAARANT